MKKMRKGFTLIEIALFLAVTGLLFVGIVAGTQNSIWQQRYNDSVQNFTNFIRNIYSEVSNPQSIGDGRSDLAIYGRLITFGQDIDLDGGVVGADSDIEQKVFVYDVVGNAYGTTGTGDVLTLLARLDANVVRTETDEDGERQVVPVGIVETYTPTWGAVIESAEDRSGGAKLFEGSILIVRHPKSGTINTLYYDGVIDVNARVAEANLREDYASTKNLLVDYLGDFEVVDVDFCVNPYGLGETGAMVRDIRIVRNARNASSVEIIDLDSEEDRCEKG